MNMSTSRMPFLEERSLLVFEYFCVGILWKNFFSAIVPPHTFSYCHINFKK